MVFEKILKFQPTRKHYCLPNSHLELPCETNYVIYTTWLLSIYKHICIYIFFCSFSFLLFEFQVFVLIQRCTIILDTLSFCILSFHWPPDIVATVCGQTFPCWWRNSIVYIDDGWTIWPKWNINLVCQKPHYLMVFILITTTIWFQVFLFELFVPSWTYIKCHQFTRTKL